LGSQWNFEYTYLHAVGISKSIFSICSSDDHQYAYLNPLYTRSQGQCLTQINIPIGAKVEISPTGFTLGVKAKIEKKIQFY
jgi:hypothetical protein